MNWSEGFLKGINKNTTKVRQRPRKEYWVFVGVDNPNKESLEVTLKRFRRLVNALDLSGKRSNIEQE